MPFNDNLPVEGIEHQVTWFSTLRTWGANLKTFVNALEARIWTGTQAQYDALATKSDTTFYFIVG